MWGKKKEEEPFVEDVQVEFNEDDLNDPHLLAELASLTSDAKPVHKKPVKVAQPEPLTITTLDEVERDIEVEFNEKDMDDPELLSELNAVAGLRSEMKNDSEMDETGEAEEMTEEAVNHFESSQVVQNDLLQELEQRQLEFKKMAIVYKKEDEMVRAREMLIASKQIQEQIDRIQGGLPLPANYRVPSAPVYIPKTPKLQVPKTPVKGAEKKTKKIETPINVAPLLPVTVSSFEDPITTEMDGKDIYALLMDAMKKQIEQSTQIAANYFKSGRKDAALEFHKRKKLYAEDLETLNACMLSSSPPPSFYYSAISYHSEILHSELLPNEMEISILRAFDLNLLSKEVTASVAFQLEGLSDDPQSATGETGWVKDVVSPDPSNPRKTTGSKLEIRIRLRTPLLGSEVITKQERWIHIDFASKKPPMDKSVSPIRESKPSTEVAAVKIPKEQPLEVPTKVSPSKQQESSEADNDIEDILLAFKNPDTIVSNLVLEHEQNLLLQEIQKLTIAKKPVPEDLVDLKDAYQIKMNLLVTLVQMGKLTMEAYIQQVKEALEDTKKKAILFKKANKLDEAKQAMVRVKLMTQEIQEVQE